MDKLLDRFLHYVSFDTQSKANVRHVPSTSGQMKLAYMLRDELHELGLEKITLDDQGCVMASLASNVSWPAPVVGFIAHLDTSPDFCGKQVSPQIVENYRGGDIALGLGDEVLSPVMFPVLHKLHGQTLITTDGRTLLGADDKAGVAEIVTAMARLKASDRPHGEIRIAFTPDEEVGKGVEHFDLSTFAADWAYTVDGGGIGELESENFNAASAQIKITGNNVHPGTAKGIMVNALAVAVAFHQHMPAEEVPEKTEGYEGFFHLTGIKGSVEKAELNYILRDFSKAGFAARKALLQEVAHRLGNSLPHGCGIEVNIEDTYFNMQEAVANHPHVVALAEQAMIDCDVQPIRKPIRGGTDGARLSLRGLPCPNLFTGGYNFHGKHEFITLEGMEKSVLVIMRIAELAARQAAPR